MEPGDNVNHLEENQGEKKPKPQQPPNVNS